MGRRRRRVWGVVIALGVLAAAGVFAVPRCGYLTGVAPTALAGGAPQYDTIELPPGFAIHAYASDVEGARSMTRGPDGVLFVGSRGAGKVYAVLDRDGDHRADEVKVIARGMNSPNGVAYRDGDLYVAEISRVVRFDDIAGHLDDPPDPVVVNDSFPTETHHGWKFIRFGPDGRLYVPVGAPCNVCERPDPFASIMRMQPDGSHLEVFARGIRNTVGFDWNPADDVLWLTDNGRDWLGDDRPPDELNRAPRAGMHFGFPYCHGRLPDPDLTDGPGCDQTVPPKVEFEAHVAALGMRFYTGDQLPARYRGGVFVAQHGSWNRTDPVGYRVVFVSVDGERAGPVQVFARGWLSGGTAWGRPVDVEVLDDGSLLVSDDKAGMIHRIHYTGDGARPDG